MFKPVNQSLMNTTPATMTADQTTLVDHILNSDYISNVLNGNEEEATSTTMIIASRKFLPLKVAKKVKFNNNVHYLE